MILTSHKRNDNHLHKTKKCINVKLINNTYQWKNRFQW